MTRSRTGEKQDKAGARHSKKDRPLMGYDGRGREPLDRGRARQNPLRWNNE